MRPNRYAQVLWAGRELLAHPGATLLIALSLGLLTTMLATALLMSQALTATTTRLLAQGPDLVVRRVTPDGGRRASGAPCGRPRGLSPRLPLMKRPSTGCRPLVQSERRVPAKPWSATVSSFRQAILVWYCKASTRSLSV